MSVQNCFVSVVAHLSDAQGYAAQFVRDCVAELQAGFASFELILGR